MRTAVVVTVAVLVALAGLALARLGEALGQLQALDALAATRGAGAARSAAAPAPAPSVHDTLEPPREEARAPATEARAAEPGAHEALAANGGDEHIRQWLVANPEFRRAAEELLQDPDPEVLQGARQLLREMGALDER